MSRIDDLIKELAPEGVPVQDAREMLASLFVATACRRAT